jgi:hypothetical protein
MSEQMNVNEQEPKAPSKEEVLAFLQEQIEVKSKQYELQELNTKLAVARAEELKALQFISTMTNPQANMPQGVPYNLTQEDLDSNPELVEAGLKVGDEVLRSEEPAPAPKPSRNLKK